MTGKLKINDLQKHEEMDRAAMRAVCGGVASERFLFSSVALPGVGGGGSNINIGTLIYQDDRDTIYAGSNALVVNTGGNNAAAATAAGGGAAAGVPAAGAGASGFAAGARAAGLGLAAGAVQDFLDNY